jgi:hypothetical protein
MRVEPGRSEGSRPVRLLRSEQRSGGRVAVMCPKLGTGPVGRWLSRRLSRPFCSVQLDDYGSFVWNRCDGRHTLGQIAEALAARSPEPAPDLSARLCLFVRQLELRGMLGWDEAPSDGDPARWAV